MSEFFSVLSLSASEQLLAAGIIFGAGLLRAYAGFGFALAAVPLLSCIMDPVQAVPLILILEVFSGLQLFPHIRHDVDWSALRILVPSAAMALPVGVYALSALPPEITRGVIAVAVLAAVIALATGFRLREPTPTILVVATGALSGLLAGSTAMSGPPVLSYFLARSGPKEQARASMLMYFLFAGAAACIVAAFSGVLGASALVTAVVLTPALALANVIGNRSFHRANPETYRRVALVSLALIALGTLAQAIQGG